MLFGGDRSIGLSIVWVLSMSLTDEFRQWALDPARTSDELFTVEILVEWGHRIWCSFHQRYEGQDYNKQRAHKAERGGNPAYRSKIDPEWIDHTIEISDRLKIFHHSGGITNSDRPLRDLQAFRFFPQFEDITVGDVEAGDLSPLCALTKLRKLSLQEPGVEGGHVIQTLSGLDGIPTLTDLTVHLRAPWPDVSALARIPALARLSLRVNLFTLRDVASLPAAKAVTLNKDYHYNTPLRDFRDLPEMPLVGNLHVDCIAGLRGIERYPRLRNLSIVGPFTDLAPLVALKELTYIRLEGIHFMDLAPLAALPSLREILLVRERPLDLEPLAQSNSLREVNVERCTILKSELSAINMGLPPWGPDFLAPEPRPIAPVRAITYDPQHPETSEFQKMRILPDDGRAAHYSEDVAHRYAETRWFQRELRQRLTTLLGQGWGGAGRGYASEPGSEHVVIQRYRDILRIHEIVQTIRELLASCRFPWSIMLCTEPHGDLADDMDEIRQRHGQEDEEGDWLSISHKNRARREDDDEDFYKRRNELYQRYEREHRFRLLQQQGGTIDPADFTTIPPEAPKTKAPAGSSEENEPSPFDGNDDDDNAGGIAEPPPPPNGGDKNDLAAKLRTIVYLDENHLWMSEHMREDAEYIFSVRCENWHTLPGPLLERPYPH